MTPDPTRSPKDRIQGLVAYFRTNRDRFTTDALKRSAADAGYEPVEIELAWSKAAWGDPERAAGGRAQPGVTALVAIMYVIGTWVGAVGLASNVATVDLAGPGILAALVGGLLGWFALRDSAPSVARGIGIGVVLAVALPLIVVAVVLGICLAMGYNPLS